MTRFRGSIYKWGVFPPYTLKLNMAGAKTKKVILTLKNQSSSRAKRSRGKGNNAGNSLSTETRTGLVDGDTGIEDEAGGMGSGRQPAGLELRPSNGEVNMATVGDVQTTQESEREVDQIKSQL